MLKRSKLPLLPGYVIDIDSVNQQKFNKSHRFMVQNETCMLSDIARPTPSGIHITEEGQIPPAPRNHWLLYDKQVLSFDACFEDKTRTRKCKIFYYLEDDTMQVVEPKLEENSGYYQGTFIHRHRIPLPWSWHKHHSNAANINTAAAQGSGYYSFAHLNVGKSVDLYGRKFNLVGCDHFTRLMLQRTGAYVPENKEIFEKTLRKVTPSDTQKHKPTKIVAPGDSKNLVLDGLVLEFNAYWDDRQTTGGQLHRLKFLYYLYDNTVEVRFSNGSPLVKRARLPKSGPIVNLGAPDQPPVLNVMKGKFLMDSKPCKGSKVDCEWIRDIDLAIGATISVYGRPVVLINCDNFTQKFYRSKYGIEEFCPLPLPYDEETEMANRQGCGDLPLPPYNGFGTFEDSAANCKKIVPVPPKRNFIKFLMKDRQGMDSHVLRFSARLQDGCDPRRFIVSYYLSDDTVSIHEDFIRNSGYPGGRFLERGQILKSNQDIFQVREPSYYGPDDFYVGAEITANDFVFCLTGADEYALSYMEKHCNEYPRSNSSLVLNKVKEALKENYKNVVAHMLEYDRDHSGTISSYQLREVLADSLGERLTEQEILTLLRRFASPQSQQPPDALLRSKVHDELRRMLFKDVDILRVELRMRDPNQTGYISRADAWAVCRTIPVPISPESLTKVLDRVKSNEIGDINHEDLLYFLDVENEPANYQMQEIFPEKKIINCDRINYLQLIKDLQLEEELVNQTL